MIIHFNKINLKNCFICGYKNPKIMYYVSLTIQDKCSKILNDFLYSKGLKANEIVICPECNKKMEKSFMEKSNGFAHLANTIIHEFNRYH